MTDMLSTFDIFLSRLSRLYLRFKRIPSGKATFVGTVLFPQIKLEKGTLTMGQAIIDRSARIWIHQGGKLTIADDVKIEKGVEIICWKNITLHSGVILRQGALLMDHDLHDYQGKTAEGKAITIGKNSIIGARSIILKGVSIGENVIIGAGAVIPKSIADGAKVFSKPAIILPPKKIVSS
jgi:acetyltransferase-like isoleucine patch superfamily enzyme